MAESEVPQEVKSGEKIENLTTASEEQVAGTAEAIDSENKQILDSAEITEPVSTQDPEIKQISDTGEITETVTAQVPGTVEDPQEVHYAEKLVEIEEEYEEEIEEDGEVKVVIKKRKVRAEKSTPLELKSIPEEEEEEVEEEYEEEEVDESGEVKVVTKKRIVKVLKRVPSKAETFISFIEVEEEYEEEELDETGETKIVKKKRLVRVPKEEKDRVSVESFEELEEEFEEEELVESGETVKVTKKRIIKVPKKKRKVSEELDFAVVEEEEETEVDSRKAEGSEEIAEEGVEEEEELGEEEVEEEEVEGEEVEEEEEYVDEKDLTEERPKKLRKKKKVLKEKVGSDEEVAVDVKSTKRKRRRRRKKKSIEEESRKSEASIETLEKEEEEEEEGKSKEGLEEERSEKKSVVISVSSAELRRAEERAAISEEFEILARLRIENIGLKRKNFYLTNKLILYFKKQKMDHAYAESKEDPEMEQRFFKKLEQFSESIAQSAEEKLNINTEWDSQRILNEELSGQVKEGWEEVMAQKKEVAAKLIDPRTGRTIQNNKIAEDLLFRQESQVQQLSECRLCLIKLKRRIEAKKKEREMDHMGADFNLMDYEKLSSLKEHFMDKIIERDIEIGEVSQKMGTMEDHLEQVKERLKLRAEELAVEQIALQRISADLNRKRGSVNKLKATRHKTEKRTARLKQESGLLAYPELLKDFEEKNQLLKELTIQIDMLKQSFRNNGMRIRRLREIISKKSSARKSLAASSIFQS